MTYYHIMLRGLTRPSPRMRIGLEGGECECTPGGIFLNVVGGGGGIGYPVKEKNPIPIPILSSDDGGQACGVAFERAAFTFLTGNWLWSWK